MKICKKCDIEKSYSDFYLDKKSKDGLRSSCKSCMSLYNKNISKQQRKDILKKSYYRNINSKRAYYQQNKEKIKENRKINHSKNRELENFKARKYSKENRKRLNVYRLNYDKKRISSDPLYRLIRNLRNLIRLSINNRGYIKNSKTQEILGCSLQEFKIYLESKFEYWMTWNNHGQYTGEYNQTWQIDHIIPISTGTNEEEIIKLNHFTNLQPLCSRKNIEKSNKIYDTFTLGDNQTRTIQTNSLNLD